MINFYNLSIQELCIEIVD